MMPNPPSRRIRWRAARPAGAHRRRSPAAVATAAADGPSSRAATAPPRHRPTAAGEALLRGEERDARADGQSGKHHKRRALLADRQGHDSVVLGIDAPSARLASENGSYTAPTPRSGAPARDDPRVPPPPLPPPHHAPLVAVPLCPLRRPRRRPHRRHRRRRRRVGRRRRRRRRRGGARRRRAAHGGGARPPPPPHFSAGGGGAGPAPHAPPSSVAAALIPARVGRLEAQLAAAHGRVAALGDAASAAAAAATAAGAAWAAAAPRLPAPTWAPAASGGPTPTAVGPVEVVTGLEGAAAVAARLRRGWEAWLRRTYEALDVYPPPLDGRGGVTSTRRPCAPCLTGLSSSPPRGRCQRSPSRCAVCEWWVGGGGGRGLATHTHPSAAGRRGASGRGGEGAPRNGGGGLLPRRGRAGAPRAPRARRGGGGGDGGGGATAAAAHGAAARPPRRRPCDGRRLGSVAARRRPRRLRACAGRRARRRSGVGGRA
ncbi:hypothetical protein BU14_0187s0007 [Porphyra umbilicalis]|uniref:Uncharacterized protein n=1 Tax=Porphyra umbilicalis TaxID=2786 RepID=A0A1X6P6R3_PORUM|nr:hypothetical protein BU14_0187s0007 [Porphyra umbilicalis]|eukprot:OSX76528.1 hypothetical protein BU14_0187s0007 [Porphyra umbilicalis]